MKKQQLVIIPILIVIGIFLGWKILQQKPGAVLDQAHGAEEAEEEMPRGPHNGRLLSDGAFSVEITIFESGIPPEFRLYTYENGKPLAPGEAQLEIQLLRLGDKIDHFKFSPRGDYLLGDGVVTEPHSFVVIVTAKHKGKSYEWKFDSLEGRTDIESAVAEASGIRAKPAGPGIINDILSTYGFIEYDPMRIAIVTPRYDGVVKELKVAIGGKVNKGDILAVLENRDTMVEFPLVAPMNGEVLELDLTLGQTITDKKGITIGDLSVVLAQLRIYPRDISSVKLGQDVIISGLHNDITHPGKVTYISPNGSARNQSILVRVDIDNASGLWKPGLNIDGSIIVDSVKVPLLVEKSGLQGFRDFTVVFAQVGQTYEVRMLELGREDDKRVEVLGGLEVGEVYVYENSFLIKADVLKDGASHDH